MIDRRRLLLTLLAGALAAPQAGRSQQAEKVRRVGLLLTGYPGRPTRPTPTELAAEPNVRALLEGLRDLGYVPGRDLILETRSAQGRLEALPRLAAELVALKVDAVVVPSTPHALAVMNLTRTIPIVMTTPGDPVGDGLVVSLARPGRNVTGLTHALVELSGKRLEILREAVPRLRRVAVLTDPSFEQNLRALSETQSAGERLGVDVLVVEARQATEFNAAFTAASRARVDAVIVLSHATYSAHRQEIIGLASKHRLPTMFSQRFFVEGGGLMAYGADSSDLFRRAATYLDKIFKGTAPSDLPVEQPSKFELVINLKTARALGLTIPPSLLLRADRVIE